MNYVKKIQKKNILMKVKMHFLLFECAEKQFYLELFFGDIRFGFSFVRNDQMEDLK